MKKNILLLLVLFNYSIAQKIDKNNPLYYKDIDNSKDLLMLRNKIEPSLTKYEYYYHLYSIQQLEELKKDENLSKLPIHILKQLTNEICFNKLNYSSLNDTLISYETTVLNKIIELDKIPDSEISPESLFYIPMCEFDKPNLENNIITIYHQCGTGASQSYKYFWIRENELISLEDIYSKIIAINNNEVFILDDFLEKKIGKGARFNYRSGVEITKLKNENYKLRFNICSNDDPECCPSYNLELETSDFNFAIKNTLKLNKN